MTIERRHDPERRLFASDNYAGAHPEVLAAIAVANGGHQTSYGEDAYTQALGDLFAPHFGAGVAAYPVFNGTGANVVALSAVADRWGAVVCSDVAHIHTDEAGAPEKAAGLKLYPVAAPDGKLTPELVARAAWGFDDEHRAKPQVLSITQSTELGTVYTPAEVAALAEHAHGLGMAVHMDGARVANAAASLGVPVREFTTDAGVDLLSFGGTKNGMLYGECVLALNAESNGALDRPLVRIRKHSMQLTSKMRFVSAQVEALLTDGLWLRSAAHANAMAARLAERAAAVPGISIEYPVQANGVFARLPVEVANAAREAGYLFYDWSPDGRVVRWMCSFDTTEDDVDGFVEALTDASKAHAVSR